MDSRGPPSYAERDPFSALANTQNEKSRPGIFDNLRGFLQIGGAFSGVPNYSNYQKVDWVKPEPGDIIHIIDATPQATGSPLSQRVMLVVRHEQHFSRSPRAMTCIPLCSHVNRLPKDDKQHWFVQQESGSPTMVGHPDQARQSRGGMPQVCQTLLVGLEPNLYLQQDITVNLGELWHIEYDLILIDKIGQVSSSSGALALKKAGELFTKSLETSCGKLKRSSEERVATSQKPSNGYWTRPAKHHT